MAKKVKKKVTTTTTVTEEVINTNETTHIVGTLDRSGSMSSIIDDMIGGFNEYLNQQRKLEDKAFMTVSMFDDQFDLLYDNVDLKKVPDFDRNNWSPRGMTNLYDAIGKTINIVKDTHAKLGSEAPDKVLFCIVTDGLHNVDGEYTSEMVKKMIKDCEKDGWTFVYLGANQDAFSVGTNLGFSGGNTYTFSADSAGAQNISATLNNATTYYRSATADNIAYFANLMDTFDVNNNVDNSLIPEEDEK